MALRDKFGRIRVFPLLGCALLLSGGLGLRPLVPPWELENGLRGLLTILRDYVQ